MVQHSEELFQVVKPGGFIHYVVGNSKFYDVVLPVESIFARLFESVGFISVSIRTIRKRTSKKELFEFVVSAQKPSLRVLVINLSSTTNLFLALIFQVKSQQHDSEALLQSAVLRC
jgi:hypothetical protein